MESTPGSSFLQFAGTGDTERVLDVGCGTGHLAAAIAEISNPAHVHAVDLSPEYIEYARARHRDGEGDGPRSYAALAWAVKGIAP
jgi:ubiquinone/menaquinone biosynthesis C-methylase UbiE